MSKHPADDPDWEMTRPLSAWEVLRIFGDLLRPLGVAIIIMLAIDDVMRLFPDVHGIWRAAIIQFPGIAYVALTQVRRRRAHA